MIQYFILDDSGEAIEATVEKYNAWSAVNDWKVRHPLYETNHCGCGVGVVVFIGRSNDEAGILPFRVEFRVQTGFSFNSWTWCSGFAYFRHRKDAITHAQALTEKVGAAWNGILDIIQQELPSKA